MKDDIFEFFCFMAPIILFVSAILVAAVVGVDQYGQYQCNNYQKLSGTETRYASFDACYVKNKGKFERWDSYKAKATAENGLSS